MQQTGTMNVWIDKYKDPESLTEENVINQVSFIRSDYDWPAENGYTLVGTAEVVVTLIDRQEMISNKGKALRAELQKVRADAEVKCNQILEQISKLEAIGYEQ